MLDERTLKSGWEEYYQQSIDKAAWKDDPSPLVSKFMQYAGFTNNIDFHIADYGCGDGRNLWPWVKAGAFVAAVDFAPTALSKIAKACLQQNVICPTLICSDMQELPLI